MTDVVLSVEYMRAFARMPDYYNHCRASQSLAGSSTNFKLAGRIAVLPVRTDPESEQSPAALETNDADDTRNRSKQIPSLR